MSTSSHCQSQFWRIILNLRGNKLPTWIWSQKNRPTHIRIFSRTVLYSVKKNKHRHFQPVRIFIPLRIFQRLRLDKLIEKFKTC